MRFFDMSEWMKTLLKAESGDGAPPAGACDPRLHDADGQQLAQQCTAMHDELESIEETTAHAPADLGIASTEQARSMRALTRMARRRARTIR